jgi:16S rRNA C1402 N4-methylase RsmH
MTMGKNNVSAHDIVNKLDQKNLKNIFNLFGEDRDSRFDCETNCTKKTG